MVNMISSHCWCFMQVHAVLFRRIPRQIRPEVVSNCWVKNNGGASSVLPLIPITKRVAVVSPPHFPEIPQSAVLPFSIHLVSMGKPQLQECGQSHFVIYFQGVVNVIRPAWKRTGI